MVSADVHPWQLMVTSPVTHAIGSILLNTFRAQVSSITYSASHTLTEQIQIVGVAMYEY